MQRNSKELELDPTKETVFHTTDGPMSYPNSAIKVVHFSRLSPRGQYARIKDCANHVGFLVVLKNPEDLHDETP
jgi:hypothetical protein